MLASVPAVEKKHVLASPASPWSSSSVAWSPKYTTVGWYCFVSRSLRRRLVLASFHAPQNAPHNAQNAPHDAPQNVPDDAVKMLRSRPPQVDGGVVNEIPNAETEPAVLAFIDLGSLDDFLLYRRRPTPQCQIARTWLRGGA